jgi:hypothetical protein
MNSRRPSHDMHFAVRVQTLKCFCVCGSIRCNLPSSPSQVACQRSPSTPGNVGDETVGFDNTQDLARFEVHLLDARFGDLKGRLAIERGSRMRESRSR